MRINSNKKNHSGVWASAALAKQANRLKKQFNMHGYKQYLAAMNALDKTCAGRQIVIIEVRAWQTQLSSCRPGPESLTAHTKFPETCNINQRVLPMLFKKHGIIGVQNRFKRNDCIKIFSCTSRECWNMPSGLLESGSDDQEGRPWTFMPKPWQR